MKIKGKLTKIISLVLLLCLVTNTGTVYGSTDINPRSRMFNYNTYGSKFNLSDYDDKVVTGLDVKKCIYNLQGMRMSIIVQTRDLRDVGEYAFNYGALLTTDGLYSNKTNRPTVYYSNSDTTKHDNEPLLDVESKSKYIIRVGENNSSTNNSIQSKGNYYTGSVSYANGIVSEYTEISGILDYNDIAYISEDSLFESKIIESEYDGTIGVYFKEKDYTGNKMKNDVANIGKVQRESGVDSTNDLKFYDNVEVVGEHVKSALKLLDTQELAIVIQTKELATLGENLAFNYGAILTSDGRSSTSFNMPGKYAKVNSGFVMGDLNKNKKLFITNKSKTAYIIKFSRSYQTGYDSLWSEEGDKMYAYLHHTNGKVDTYYDIAGTKEKSNIQYINAKARFIATLIENPTYGIIGIFFKEL